MQSSEKPGNLVLRMYACARVSTSKLVSAGAGRFSKNGSEGGESGETRHVAERGADALDDPDSSGVSTTAEEVSTVGRGRDAAGAFSRDCMSGRGAWVRNEVLQVVVVVVVVVVVTYSPSSTGKPGETAGE